MKKLLHLILPLFLFSSGLLAQQKQIDSLKHIIEVTHDDSIKCISFQNLIKINYFSGSYKTADSLAHELLSFSIKINRKRAIASAYNILGLINENQTNYPEALKYHLECLKLEEDIDNQLGIAAAYGNIGIIYFDEGNYHEAINYLKKGLEILKKSNSNKGNIAIAYLNLGNAYSKLNNLDEALKDFLYSLSLFSELNDKRSIASLSLNIGLNYFSRGNYDSAYTFSMRALKLAKEFRVMRAIVTSYENLGSILIHMKKFKKAKVYSDSALILGKEISARDLLTSIYTDEALIDSAFGDYKASLAAFKLHALYQDSIKNDEDTKKIIQAQMTYDFDKKEATQKAEQDKKDAVRDSEEARQKTVIWLIASVTLTLILLLIVILQRMKNVEKKKLIAEQQKAWLELKALRTQMNPHFLYNTINSIQSFVLNNDSKSSYNYLAQFAGLMRNTLDNSRKEKISLTDEVEGLKNYLDFEAMRFPAKFNYEIKVDQTIDQAKVFIPPLLIQPFVENAIWHGLMHLKNNEGKLLISFEKGNNGLKCTVDDNGIGRAAAAGLKKSSVHKSVGLSITAERMESMNKMYHWDMKTITTDKTTSDGKPAGTRVEIFLPLIQNPVVYA